MIETPFFGAGFFICPAGLGRLGCGWWIEMISSRLQSVIGSAAKEFDVEAVWLFGTARIDEAAARDIDLAVEGLPSERFFDFYDRLYFALPKPVDLVDLSQDPPIAAIVRAQGVRIYERRS